MDVRTKALGAIDLHRARGLEIGPLHNPRLRKDEADVRYVDIAPADELRAKYADNPRAAPYRDRLVDVDYLVRPGKTLADAVGKDAPFDFVIASHVFEHVADPIGWLAQVSAVLRAGGILSLVVPDKRYCFDANRPLTVMADLVDAYLRGLNAPGYRQVYDHEVHFIDVNARRLWAGQDVSADRRADVADPDVFAYTCCLDLARSGEYRDVHCSTFTPESFLGLLEKMSILGLNDFEVIAFHPTERDDYEFFATLRRLPVDAESAGRRATLATAPPPARAWLHGEMSVSILERRLILAKRGVMATVRGIRNRVRQRPSGCR